MSEAAYDLLALSEAAVSHGAIYGITSSEVMDLVLCGYRDLANCEDQSLVAALRLVRSAYNLHVIACSFGADDAEATWFFSNAAAVLSCKAATVLEQMVLTMDVPASANIFPPVSQAVH